MNVILVPRGLEKLRLGSISLQDFNAPNDFYHIVGIIVGRTLIGETESVIVSRLTNVSPAENNSVTNIVVWEDNLTQEKINLQMVRFALITIALDLRSRERNVDIVFNCVRILQTLPLEIDDNTSDLKKAMEMIRDAQISTPNDDTKFVKRIYELYVNNSGLCRDIYEAFGSANTYKFVEIEGISVNNLLYKRVGKPLELEQDVAIKEMKYTRFRSAIYTVSQARKVVTHVVTNKKVPEDTWEIDTDKFGTISWPRFISDKFDEKSMVLMEATDSYAVLEIIIDALSGKTKLNNIILHWQDMYIDVKKICNDAEKIIALCPIPKMSVLDAEDIKTRKRTTRDNISSIRKKNLACLFALASAYRVPTFGSIGLRKVLEMWNLMTSLHTGPDVEFNLFLQNGLFNERCSGHIAELMLRVYVDRFVLTDVDPRLPKEGLQWGNYARYLDRIYRDSTQKGFFPLYWPWEGRVLEEISLPGFLVQLNYAYPSSLTELPVYLYRMFTNTDKLRKVRDIYILVKNNILETKKRIETKLRRVFTFIATEETSPDFEELVKKFSEIKEKEIEEYFKIEGDDLTEKEGEKLDIIKKEAKDILLGNFKTRVVEDVDQMLKDTEGKIKDSTTKLNEALPRSEIEREFENAEEFSKTINENIEKFRSTHKEWLESNVENVEERFKDFKKAVDERRGKGTLRRRIFGFDAEPPPNITI